MIGNRPKESGQLISGKLYWWVACGRESLNHARIYEWGWRAFEVAFIRYDMSVGPGKSQRYIFHFGFSFWLPIASL